MSLLDPSATVEVNSRSAPARQKQQSLKRVDVRWAMGVRMSDKLSWRHRVVETSRQSPARYCGKNPLYLAVHELEMGKKPDQQL